MDCQRIVEFVEFVGGFAVVLARCQVTTLGDAPRYLGMEAVSESIWSRKMEAFGWSGAVEQVQVQLYSHSKENHSSGWAAQ